MLAPTPIYLPTNTNPAYQLNCSVAFLPRGRIADWMSLFVRTRRIQRILSEPVAWKLRGFLTLLANRHQFNLLSLGSPWESRERAHAKRV
ncbi:MAG: hypothetical protein KDB22_11505, partial [Planctomycetales bacterium]|nr:hypothetical protein [Planctomycetales bacterium]